MADELANKLIDAIDIVKDCALAHEDALEGHIKSRNQVRDSGDVCRRKTQKYFLNLRKFILEMLNDRETLVLEKIEEVHDRADKPLSQLEEEAEEDLCYCITLLDEGKELCGKDPVKYDFEIEQFSKKAKSFEKNNPPDAPGDPHDIACLAVELPTIEMLTPTLQKLINHLGVVLASSPLKFNVCEQWPGALRLDWEESLKILEENNYDMSDFIIEKARGRINWNDNDVTWEQVYKGQNRSFVVRGLEEDEAYSFRIQGKAKEAELWCAWSVPLVALTTIAHHEWDTSNPGYTFTNNNRILERTGEGPFTVLSGDASLICGESIMFEILGVPTTRDNEVSGIFLSTTKDIKDDLMVPGCLLISTQGKIYVNGEKKTTEFPALDKDTVITFATDVTNYDKPRITIEVNEYTVTFDWAVETQDTAADTEGLSQAGSMKDRALYFGAHFTTDEWQVKVV